MSPTGTSLQLLVGLLSALLFTRASATNSAASNPPDSVAIEFFESRIRPVLAQDCYECHRTGGKTRGDLALDHRQALLTGGESGPAIVPGNPGDSLLLKVIRHEIPDLAMPRNGAQLEPEVIRDFEKWIRMGAPDPRDQPASTIEVGRDTGWPAILERRKQWWSFQPVQKPSVPEPIGPNPSHHPIDRFIRARLAQTEIPPAPRAQPLVLLRRLSFALRGLPPTPEEVAEVSSGSSSASPEAWVERFLASPEFGERWARHWMDWMRYADSHGSEGDATIPNAWQYRDYLIRALNADVPYPQLLREHIAGDLLPSPRINATLGLNESAIGPAHLRMVLHGFAPTDALEELVRFTDDQINVVSKAFLGLTVSCARCHDHKFDPISQNDFYGWYGILSSCAPAQIAADAPSPDEDRIRSEMSQLRDRIRIGLAAEWMKATETLGQRLTRPDPNLAEAMRKAEKVEHLLHPFHVVQAAPADPSVSPGKAIEAWRKRISEVVTWNQQDSRLRWDLTSQNSLGNWTTDGPGMGRIRPPGFLVVSAEGDSIVSSIQPAAMISQADSPRDRGVALSPKVHLDGRYDLWVRVAGDGGAVVRFVVQNYPRDGTVYPVQRLSGGQWRWMKLGLEYWDGDRIHLELSTAADQPVLADVNAIRSWFALSEVRMVPEGHPAPPEPLPWIQPLTEAMDPTAADADAIAAGFVRAIRTAVEAWANGTATTQQALLLDQSVRAGLLPNQLSQLPDLQPLIDRHRSREAALRTPTRVPGVLESQPADAPLFVRGDHRQPASIVPRHFLDAIDPSPYVGDGSGRMKMAEDLLRADNPLTARVIVNRIWTHLFGRGLVATPDNLGRMGQPPSHPELLDYLADRFASGNGSIKELIRFIVTSETWCAANEPFPAARERDPANRLLSHFPVRRLEAEAIRDTLLSVSGSLETEKRFGPPINGRTPRRSVYVRVKRNELDPLLATFDTPAPSTTTGARDVTNVPGQALTLLNDPFILELAEKWGGGLIRDPTLQDPDARMASMFIRALGRPITPDEQTRTREFLDFARSGRQARTGEMQRIESSLHHHRDAVAGIRSRAGQRIAGQRNTPTTAAVLPTPLASWDFSDGFKDGVGKLHGRPVGKARVDAGRLLLDGKTAAMVTDPIPVTIRAKTFEVWVRLGTLQQQGGGVITLQTLDGSVFDSLVFGEQTPGHWLAGSDFFNRTASFNGTIETEAVQGPVHLALVYAEDGSITAYRNGQPYGKGYRSSGPIPFDAGRAQILLGNRHGEPGGNRLLAGEIHTARLYNRALTEAEIRTLASDSSRPVTEADLAAALSGTERDEIRLHLDSVRDLELRMETLKRQNALSNEWADLAHALFNLKEFVFVR